MTQNAESVRTVGRPVPLSRGQTVVDLVVAGVLLVVALAVHVSGIEAVAQNRATGVLSVALTVLAVGPLALRRRYPLPVLVVTLAALLALIATRSGVGLAFLGPVVAFYTAVALGSRRSSRTAIAVVVAAFLLHRAAASGGPQRRGSGGQHSAVRRRGAAWCWCPGTTARLRRRHRRCATGRRARRGACAGRARAGGADRRAGTAADHPRAA